MLLKPHYTCGIELTAGSMRMVRADTHNRQDSCLFIPMPKGMCKGALIQSPKLLGKTIRQELKAHRFNPGRRCVLSISATNARIRLTQMPHLESDALHANVVSDMCRYFSMDADEFYIDYVVQEVLRSQRTEAPQVRVLMLALPKQEVESYLEAFRYAGIPIRAVAITQNVIGKLLRSTGQRQGLSIVLTLNHTSASVDCFLDGWLFISKSLGAGLYAAAAEYYAHGLASDADSAHRALLQQAQNPQQGNAVAQGYLDAFLAEYIKQVTQLIEYCRKRTGHPAQRLLLCGHAMDMPGIAHAFTGLIADNTVHISTLLPNAPQGCTDCCTVAYASLLRDTKLEPARGRKTTQDAPVKNTIDLIAQRNTARSKANMTRTALLISLLLALWLPMIELPRQRLLRVQAQLALSQQQAAGMQQLQVEYEQALTRKQQAEELLASLQANVARAQLVGYIDALSAARPQSVELLQTDYQNDSLVLSGRASDMQAISAFTSELEGGGAFHGVQLQQVAYSDGLYEFEILLHIPPQSNTPLEDDPHEVE